MHLAALSLNSFVENAADNVDLAGLEERKYHFGHGSALQSRK